MRKIKVPHDPDYRPTCHLTQVVSLKISRLALNTRLLYLPDTQPYTSYLRLHTSITRQNTVSTIFKMHRRTILPKWPPSHPKMRQKYL